MSGGQAFAQAETPVEAIPDAVTSDLRFTMNRLVTAGRLTEAVPYLEELIRRFEASQGARFEQELERFYYFISAAFMQMENYDDAITILKKYTAKFSAANDAPTMLEWLGDCHRLNKDLPNAAVTYKLLRSRHTLRGTTLDEVISKEAGCLAQLEQWDDATPLLTQLLNQARDPNLRSQAATLLVRAYLALDQIDQIVKLLPQLLAVSRSRYDADFNIMLIHGGDTKYHAGDFAAALMLYQLALTKEELLAWHDQQIMHVEEALRHRSVPADYKAATAMRNQLKDLRSGREEITRRDSYTEELFFRKGQAYFELQQKWEAFWTFWSIWKTLPRSELSRQALYSAFVLAGELNMDQRALEFGRSFMDAFGVGDYFDEITLQMANLHLRRKEFAEAIAISQEARTLNPEHAFSDRLLFISGYSLFQQGDLGGALVAFQEVRETYPDSESEEGAIYWIGMTHLFRQNFESARDEFSEFCARYVGGVYFEDARFRLGVSEYGLADFKPAREHFEKFIEQFPGSLLRSEAHSFLGDIAGAEGRLNDAVEQYRQVATHTDQMQQINYAAFQIGKILELQGRYEDMAEFFQQYMQAYRLDGQYTEALHRLGFAKKMMGDTDGMLKTYEDAIRRYGHRQDALGIDLILRDWVAAFHALRSELPVAWLQKEIQEAQDKKSETLRWRLQWALSDLCGEPSPETFAEVDLRNFTPAVLEWIGRVGAARQPDLARAALEKVVEEFPDSPWVEAALSSWAEMEARSGQAAKALVLFERQFEQFPTSVAAGHAAKRIADMKFELRRYDDAVKDYLKVLEIREWRGPLWAESLYQIGNILLAQGKLQEAFGYFQRVYVLYEGYPEWATRAYVQSGMALERLNRRREAIATYQELLSKEKFSGTEAARDAEKRLAALQ